jgi:hypothetical protein
MNYAVLGGFHRVKEQVIGRTYSTIEESKCLPCQAYKPEEGRGRYAEVLNIDARSALGVRVCPSGKVARIAD